MKSETKNGTKIKKQFFSKYDKTTCIDNKIHVYTY